MLNKRIHHALVGLFVIVFGLVWLGITLWLALGDYSIQYKTYRVYLDESVAGLYLDAPVKYRGVEVGKVTRIELNPEVPDQVQLTLDVVATTPIRVDTEAELAVQGLTGIAFVDLKGGSLDSPLLKPGENEDYPVIKSSPSFFTRLDMSSTELIANFNAIANRLAQLLDADGRKSFKDLLANLGVITGTMAAHKDELGKSLVNLSRMTSNGAQASEELKPLFVQVRETTKSFQTMADRVTAVSEGLQQSVGDESAGLQQFARQTLPEFGALVSELRSLADSLQVVAGRLEDDPRVLLYGNQLQQPGPGE